jgi:RNase P/RNase MRP subunit POP5
MVVKSKIGRKRYIVFKIYSDLEISKRDLIYTLRNLINNKLDQPELGNNSIPIDNTINSTKRNSPLLEQEHNSKSFNRMPWIIFLKSNYGLIQCHHLDKNKTINLLHSIRWTGKMKNNVNIATLGTTGTIRSARKKYLDKLNIYPLNNNRYK